MRIAKSARTSVSDLKPGDCFEYCWCYYIKTDIVQEQGAECVELESGCIAYFPENDLVIPVDIECTVKQSG